VKETYNVVVVGSGVAGLGAAIEAAERGASVLVLEGAESLGGASAISGAACCIVGSPLQQSLGIEDSVELALSDWMATGGPSVDVPWARKYLEASRAEVHDWLCDMGIVWDAVARHDGNSVARWHRPVGWGRAVIGAMTERADANGVDILRGAMVQRIGTDGTRVDAVDFVFDGMGRKVGSDAVVVCTGGFVSNLGRLLQEATHLKKIDRLLCGGASTAQGSGHDLLATAGAQFAHLDNVWVYPNGTPDPDDPGGMRGVGVRSLAGAIWLNQNGQRFHNEAQTGARLGTPALLAQPQQTCWVVFSVEEMRAVTLIDNLRWGDPSGPDAAAMEEFWKTSEHAWIARDLDELARMIGLPEDAVRETVSAFDAAIDNGLDSDPAFGRPLEGARRLGSGPVAALQFFPMAQKNFGGVRTDLSGRVIGIDGSPIPGLFAAGEVAGMAGGHVNGAAALEGTMYGPCLYSGRVAGAAAAF
jgi:flavocytochrome c